MNGADTPTTGAGPFRIGSTDVFVRTGSSDFERAVRWAFADLGAFVGGSEAEQVVVFDVDRQAGPPIVWAVRRDGAPCEMELMEDAVLVHLQWELNRLAIESQPAAIHSAAVARGGRAALLLGASHSGKTTLAGWLAAHHDADYLTDEVAAIDGQGRVAPFRRPLGVRSDSPLAALIPPESMDVPARFLLHERLVPASDLGARLSAASVSIGLLVFPSFAPAADLSVEPLDQAEAFERLAALTPGLTSHGRVVFEQLCRMVEAAPAIAVRYGDVRHAAPVVIDALERGGRP